LISGLAFWLPIWLRVTAHDGMKGLTSRRDGRVVLLNAFRTEDVIEIGHRKAGLFLEIGIAARRDEKPGSRQRRPAGAIGRAPPIAARANGVVQLLPFDVLNPSC